MNLRIAVLAITALAIPGSFVGASYPQELVLQHIPTILGIALLSIACFRYQPSRISFVCCIAFLWLHLIGARWIYSFVPYDTWTEFLTGRRLSDLFGWQRNHYDRLVHFASGLLGLPPLAELLQKFCGTRPLASTLLGISCVLAIGAGYEVLEWAIAVTLSPEMAESYNGQQGDPWDPQKDLALAWLGTIGSAAFVFGQLSKSSQTRSPS